MEKVQFDCLKGKVLKNILIDDVKKRVLFFLDEEVYVSNCNSIFYDKICIRAQGNFNYIVNDMLQGVFQLEDPFINNVDDCNNIVRYVLITCRGVTTIEWIGPKNLLYGNAINMYRMTIDEFNGIAHKLCTSEDSLT